MSTVKNINNKAKRKFRKVLAVLLSIVLAAGLALTYSSDSVLRAEELSPDEVKTEIEETKKEEQKEAKQEEQKKEQAPAPAPQKQESKDSGNTGSSANTGNSGNTENQGSGQTAVLQTAPRHRKLLLLKQTIRDSLGLRTQERK